MLRRRNGAEKKKSLQNIRTPRGVSSSQSTVKIAAAVLLFVGLAWMSSSSSTSSNIRKPSSPTAWTGQYLQVRSATDDNAHLWMPAIGYGTCCRKTAKGEPIYQSTKIYLELGGRQIDTAMAYGNHKEIGRAIKDSGVPREDIWVTSKIAVSKVEGQENTVEAVKKILEDINTPYLDLVLIHSPKMGKKNTMDIWKGLIDASKQGLIRAIGVSNMNRQEILDLKEATAVMPALNEIQYHPWTPSLWKDQVKWQASNDIATIAYTSLGGSRFNTVEQKVKWPLTVTELADKYRVSPAQLLLKWALQQNVGVIPGSSSKPHIEENLNIPDFTITTEECHDLESVEAPKGWFDPKRGPAKMSNEQAGQAWL